MAYPNIVTTATSTSTSGTTLTANWPTGIVAGDVCVAYLTNASSAGGIGFPSEWVDLANAEIGTEDALSAHVAAYQCDGTESGTFSITVNNAAAAVIVHRLEEAENPNSGNWQCQLWSSHNTSPIFVPGSQRSMYSITNPLLPYGYGRYDRYLGLVSFHHSENPGILEYPQNYANLQSAHAGTSPNDCGVHVLERNIQGLGEFADRWRIYNTADGSGFNTLMVVPPKERYVIPSTFPYINKIKHTPDSGRTSSTNFRVQLPDLEPGDVVFVCTATYNADSNTVTFPTETGPYQWEELYDTTGGGGGTPLNSTMAWKKADGTEKRYIDVGVDDNPCVAVAFTVTNIPDPEITMFLYQHTPGFAQVSGAGTIAPPEGSDNYLWVALHARQYQAGEYKSFPTNHDGRLAFIGEWANWWEDPHIVLTHTNDETARASVNSDYIDHGTSMGTVTGYLCFYPGSFDPCWQYHVGRVEKGRGQAL